MKKSVQSDSQADAVAAGLLVLLAGGFSGGGAGARGPRHERGVELDRRDG